MTIGVKEVGKDIKYVSTNEKYMTKCYKNFVDSYPDKVIMEYEPGKGSLVCLVDGDGLAKELPINFLMKTQLCVEKIVGTVVFMRLKELNGWDPYDYEVDELTEEDKRHIEKTLDAEIQKKLEKHYIEYGKGFFVVKEFDKDSLLNFLRRK